MMNRHSVDKIVAGFAKVVEQLESACQHHYAKAAHCEDMILDYNLRKQQEVKEAVRAERLVAKFKELVE